MKRSILGILLGVAFSVVGVVISGLSVDQPPNVHRVWAIALAIIVMGLAWLVQGTVLALLAQPVLKTMKVLDMTRLYLSTQAVGAMTPFGGVELGYQLLELRRRGISLEYGSAMLTIKGIFNGTFLVGGAAVAIIFVSGIPIIRQWYLLAAIAVIVAVWMIFVLLIKMYRGRGQESGEREKRSQYSRVYRMRQKVSGFLREMIQSLRSIWRQNPRVVVLSGLLMLVYWMLYPLLGVLALFAASWSGEGWFVVLMAQFILYFVIPFAPTPGNSGAAEIAFTALMGAYVSGGLLAGVLIWRALNHYSELVVGAFIVGRYLEDDIRFAKEELKGSD